MKWFRPIYRFHAVSGALHVGLLCVAFLVYVPEEAKMFTDDTVDRLINVTFEFPKPTIKPKAPVEAKPVPRVVKRSRPQRKPPKRVKTSVKETKLKEADQTVGETVTKSRKPDKNTLRVIGAKSKEGVVRDEGDKRSPQDVSPKGPVASKSGADGAPPAQLGKKRRGELERRYYTTLRRHLDRNYVYPRRAQLARIEGVVLIEIVVDARGKILRRRIIRSSGSPILDEAAMKAVAKVSSVPAPPSELPWTRRAIRVPFNYQLKT